MINYKLQITSYRFNKLIIRNFISIWILQSVICNLQPAISQQMPYYTQFNMNNAFLNPAFVGTKRFIDARTNYRMQWVGFQDAPVTEGISLNSRLMNGSMGLGTSFFSDQTGPTRRSDISFAYSYHIKFDDVELSAGLAYDRLTYFIDGTMLNMHTPGDNAIDLSNTQRKSANNASAGLLFYNDRFHLGLSALNLLEPSYNFSPTNEARTGIHMVPHIYGSMGYNWSGDPNWIWENSLMVLYAQANPMNIDYNLRIHYKQQFFGGISLRLKDAVALQAGVTFKKDFQISYSYDIVTSSLRSFQFGSQEIMLIWSSNIGKEKQNKYDNTRFKRQKYGFMF